MFNANKISIGISPILWINEDMTSLGANNNFEQLLSEVALSKYSGTEIGINFPQDIAKLRYHLHLRHLKIASQWLSTYLVTRDFEPIKQQFIQTIKFLNMVNAPCINICEMSYNLFRSDHSMFTDKPTMTDKQWQLLCKRLDELGQLAYKQHIKLCYHHHIGTVIQTAEEISFLMENTNPKYVHLCMDTADLILADIKPTPFIHKMNERIAHVHLKDLHSEKFLLAQQENYSFRDAICHNFFTVPGDGNGYINFQEIFQALDDINYTGWLIVEMEQNPDLVNPFEYALKARYFLTAMLDL